MQIIRDKKTLAARIAAQKARGHKVAFVPTMGALHDGHLSLVRSAGQHAECVVVSIFVNPAQFGKNEDLGRYPRKEAEDLAMLEKEGVGIAYLPSVSEIYPEGFSTYISVKGVSEGLCGDFRPQFFDGVALVVTKLFLQVQPNYALFGEKDYQQLCVIRKMVTDLDIPVNILSAPTARAADGLALSSRNQYLSPGERAIAPALYETLLLLDRRMKDETRLDPFLCEWGKGLLLDRGFNKVDYLEVRDAGFLRPVTDLRFPSRIFVAAWLGSCRLIDNIPVAVSGHS